MLMTLPYEAEVAVLIPLKELCVTSRVTVGAAAWLNLISLPLWL